MQGVIKPIKICIASQKEMGRFQAKIFTRMEIEKLKLAFTP